MPRSKQKRIDELKLRDNVISSEKEIYNLVKGNWNSLVFKNDNDIVLELGCGKGNYTVGLARFFPERNYVGIDVKGARLWSGSTYSIKFSLKNVAFLRTNIFFIDECFAPDEVSEIWMTFPDPHPKNEKRRLIQPSFLEKYKKILKPNGIIHLKTDHSELLDFSLEVLKKFNAKIHYYTNDLYNSDCKEESALRIKTNYEKIFLAKGYKIKYLKFSL